MLGIYAQPVATALSDERTIFPVGLTGNPGLYLLSLLVVGLYGVDGLQPSP